MHDNRQDKMGWQDDKTRAPDARWDKQPAGPFPERPQPSTLDDGLIAGLRPGGGQPGGKWREDGDRVLPRRDIPAPPRYIYLLFHIHPLLLRSLGSIDLFRMMDQRIDFAAHPLLLIPIVLSPRHLQAGGGQRSLAGGLMVRTCQRMTSLVSQPVHAGRLAFKRQMILIACHALPAPRLFMEMQGVTPRDHSAVSAHRCTQA